MSARIIQFPQRGRFDVRVEREADGPSWLVLLHDRSHGWLRSDFIAALFDAHEIAAGFGTAVVSSAGIAP
jgi:hypothetical protein